MPFEQRAVELRRRHVADHRAPRADRRADRRSHAAARHALDVHAGLARAALRADERDQRIGELRAAAARNRHAALLHRDGDHLRHVAGRRRVRAEARVQHPRRQQAVRPLGRERLLEPVARRDEQPARELDRAAPAEPAVRLQPERSAVPRPELRAEDPEREVGVREELGQERPPGGAVEVRRAGVRLGRAQQERAVAVRGQRACPSGARVFRYSSPWPREVVAELRVRRRRRPRAGARR